MPETLATRDALPKDYLQELRDAHVAPLWPVLRNLMPHDAPTAVTQSCLWRYRTLRPLVLRAGELTPVEKAERRVLYLSDPGREQDNMQVTSTIYAGLQLLRPGETAPAHKHTASAARIVIEGEGAYTVVEGEKLPMSPGDLILTPIGCRHDHGHEGHEPVIWLDALDMPLYVYLEGSYAVETPLQSQRNRPDASQLEYRSTGLIPPRQPGAKAHPWPMMRYPWQRTKEALCALAAHSDAGVVELDYINPETGEPCLPVLGFTAMRIPAGTSFRPQRRSTSALYHIVSGRGCSIVNGEQHDWQDKDSFSAPVFADVSHKADDKNDVFMIRVHDRPLQEKLGCYEERPA